MAGVFKYSVERGRGVASVVGALALILLGVVNGYSQAPTNTINVIEWNIDGTPFTGTMTISGPSFTTTGGVFVQAMTKVVNIPAGTATVVLVPTDIATSAVTYQVTLTGPNTPVNAGTFTWTVPSTPTPLTLQQVQWPVTPSSQLIVPLPNLQQAGATNGQIMTWVTGTGWTPGTGTPGSGTVTLVSAAGPPFGASWLTGTVTNPSTIPVIQIAPTAGQTPGQVIGTCGSATSFGPCTLTLTDIPIGGVPTAGQVPVAVNGTSVTWQTLPAGFTNPMTTLGDFIVGGASGAAVRFPVNASGTKMFLTETSSVPQWLALTSGDVTGALGFTPLSPANNLSELASASTARTNLGLGTAAVDDATAFDAAGSAAAVLATSLQKASNLSDLANAGTSRTNLGVAIGSNVEAWAANLDSWAAIATSAKQNTITTGTTSQYIDGTLSLQTFPTFENLAPAATVEGTIIYWDTGTSKWKILAGNTSGTNYLQETAAGVPSWTSPGGGVSSFSGDGTFANNSSSTGAVTFTLATAAAHSYWGNNTGTTGAEGYHVIALGELTSTFSAPLNLSTNTVTCATCIVASSPTAGIARSAGSTQTITFAELSGDVTTSGSNAVTVTHVHGVTYGATPGTNTVPVVTGSNVVTYEAVPNAALANSSVSFNGQSVALGATGNVNTGAAAHSVALNEGAGAVLAGVAIGTGGRLLIDQGASVDPAFEAMSGDATLAANGAITVVTFGGLTPVSVLSAGTLCSTCIVTGGGTTKVQTANTSATMDSSGNISTPGTGSFGVGGTNAGVVEVAAGAAQTADTGSWGFTAPATVTTPFLLETPNAVPAANQIMLFPAPTSGVSQWAWLTLQLSGDVTSSAGSLAATVVKINGGSVPANTHVGGYNSGSQPTQSTAADVSAIIGVAGGGTANAQTVTLSPAVAALTSGLTIKWLPTAANTSTAVTVNLNGLGTAALDKQVAGAPAVVDIGDLSTTIWATAIYDGTEWVLQNPINAWTNSSQSVVPASDFICFHHGDTSFTFPGTVTACNSLTTDPTVNTAFNTGITIPANTLKAGRQARICSNQNLISNAGAGSIGSRFFVNSVSTVALSTTPAWTPLASATTPGAQFQECVDVIGTVAPASSANVLFAQETTGFAANIYSIAGLLQRSATQPLAINTAIPNTFYFGIANVGSGVGAGITYASGSSACTNGTQTVAFTNGGGTAGAGTITVSGGVPSGAVTITNTGNTYTSVPTTGTITTCTGAATFTGGALAGSQGAGVWQQSLYMQPIGN